MLGPGSHVDVTLSFMRVRVMCRPFLLRSYVAEVSRERSGISFVVMEAFIAVVFIGCVSGKSALGLTVLFFFSFPSCLHHHYAVCHPASAACSSSSCCSRRG